MIKSILNWIVFSSKDPAKVSATLKSIGFFLVFLGADTQLVDEASSNVVEFAVQAGTVVTAATTLWYFARKLYFSLHALFISLNK